jgi:arylformamidase
MTQDPNWYEAEYNPRLSVADAADYAPKWKAWAEATRQSRPIRADLRYGRHPREIMDIFPVENAKGALVFIHGGYWRVHSKDVFSWAADALVDRGISVAVINYPLCPEVSVGDIVASCRRAVACLWKDHLTPVEKANLAVSGHSAGGYLTGAMFATDWTKFGLPAAPFVGGVPISGVFDVSPLIHTSINVEARFTPESAAALNLFTQKQLVDAPFVPIYGALESSEFHRQSEEIARLWPHTEPAIGFSNRHHFNVVEGIREPGSPLLETILRLLQN